MDIKSALARIVEGDDLTQDESAAVFQEIMTGVATPAQMGALLAAIRVKGETPPNSRRRLDHARAIHPGRSRTP